MSAQFDDFNQYTQQFAASAIRANQLALESAGTAFGVQLKAFEGSTSATAAFLGEVASARGLESVQALWPKGLQVARDSLARAASASQEVFGLSLKTSEALGQLARDEIATFSDRFKASVAQAGKVGRRSN